MIRASVGFTARLRELTPYRSLRRITRRIFQMSSAQVIAGRAFLSFPLLILTPPFLLVSLKVLQGAPPAPKIKRGRGVNYISQSQPAFYDCQGAACFNYKIPTANNLYPQILTPVSASSASMISRDMEPSGGFPSLPMKRLITFDTVLSL